MISSGSDRNDITKTLLLGNNASLDIQNVRFVNIFNVYYHLSSSLPQTNGWSALFFAADVGDKATTKLLLKAGADPHLRDKV